MSDYGNNISLLRELQGYTTPSDGTPNVPLVLNTGSGHPLAYGIGETNWLDGSEDDDDDDVVTTVPSATTSMYDGDHKLKSYEQAMADWDAANPEPTAPTMGTAQVSKPMSYDDILAQYDAVTSKNAEKEAKRERARRNLAMLTDGINAITNLVGTSKGAGQTYDPATSATSQWQARKDKIDAAQVASRKAYRDLAYKQAALAQQQYKTDVAAQVGQNKAAQTAYANDAKARATERNRYATAYQHERSYNADQEKFANTKQQQAFSNNMREKEFVQSTKPQISTTFNTSSNTHDVIDAQGGKHTVTGTTTTRSTRTTRR